MVVLTRSYATGVGIIRALGVAGYTVDVVASSRLSGLGDFVKTSKFVHEYQEVLAPKFRAEDQTDINLVNALLEYKGRYPEKPVLFPTDDYTASVMDLSRDLLSEVFLMPEIAGGKEGAMVQAMDKAFQSDLAKNAEILTPKEWLIDLYVKDLQIPEDMVYPCFVKPVESISGYKKDMAACKNQTALWSHLNSLKNKGRSHYVLVQEFLKIKQEIDLSGICLDQEVIIPGIIKKTCVAQYETGVTLSGMIYPFEAMEDYCEKILDMMRSFHYVGMFDMEFNVVEDGRVFFNEVNLRSGGPNFSYFKAGANLPAVFVDEITCGCHLENDTTLDSFGQNFIYEKVAWEDYLNGFMTEEVLKKRLKEADFGLLYFQEDPGPYNEKLAEFNRLNKNLKSEQFKRKIREKYEQNKLVQFSKNKLEIAKEKFSGLPQQKKENQRKKYNGRPRVLVAGRNYCSNLSIARSLGEAGYEVEVMHVFNTLPGKNEKLRSIVAERYSKYVKAFYLVVTLRVDNTLYKELKHVADKNNKMLLIPADDLVASVADLYYSKLKKYYILPNVADKEGGIDRLMDKGIQKELARKANLPVLNSCVVRAERGWFELPDGISYPCFIKPAVSRQAAKSRMHRCDTREELEGWLKVFSERRRVFMLIEDYVEIANEYSILGVSTKHGAIGPAAFVAVKGGSAEHRGVALTGKILPLDALQPLADQLIDFVGSLNYEGLYDIDLVEAEDGTIYFVEINMRLGASGYAFTKCGVNLPAMYADYMIYRKPLDRNVRIQDPGKIFVSEKVLMDEYGGNRLEKEEYEAILKDADIYFIKNEADPGPWRHFSPFFKDAAKQRQNVSFEQSVANIPLEERLADVNQRAVESVMKKTYWSEEQTREKMQLAEERYGLSDVQYDALDLWRIPEEQVPVYLQEMESQRNEQASSIQSVSEHSGWSYDKSEEMMQKALKKRGVSYQLYDAVNLWRVPEKQQMAYLTCIDQTGCTEEEYFRYNLGELSEYKRSGFFLNADSKRIADKYNVDQASLDLVSDPESFYRSFRLFLRRACGLSSKMTKEQFAEMFSNCGKIVFRPLAKSGADVALLQVNAYNMAAAYDALSEMGEGVIEQCLIQHPALEALSPNAMAKLRIVTVSAAADEETGHEAFTDIAYAVLRTGDQNGQEHQFYNGNLFALVDTESGVLLTDAADYNCTSYPLHPVSKLAFKDFAVPLYDKAIAIVNQAIKKNKMKGYFGWDFVITERAPMLVEVIPDPAPVLLCAPLAAAGEAAKMKMEKYL